MPYHRSEEHTSELQSHDNLVCRLLLEKKKKKTKKRQPNPRKTQDSRRSGHNGESTCVKLERGVVDLLAVCPSLWFWFFFFFFNNPAPPEIYPLSLPDALPISARRSSTCSDVSGRPTFKHLHIRTFLSRSEEHTSELQSHDNLVCRLLLEK